MCDVPMRKFIAYYRVSTQRQGMSGLGLFAQQSTVMAFIESRHGELLEAFTEVESGKKDDRPQLAEAFRLADVTKATVVFAKLDRLSRNASFLLNLNDAGVKFVALDCPELDTLSLGMRAVIAQHERETISARTKAALAVARDRGTKLGNPDGLALKAARRGRELGTQSRIDDAIALAAKLAPIVAIIKVQGETTLSGIASALNAKRILTPRGSCWDAKAVSRLLERLPA